MGKTLLIVGGGGREHALAWKLAQERGVAEVICAPGNAGTATVGRNLALAADDLDGLTAWAVEHRPDLVVIGPEAPLCLGLADRLAEQGLRVFGPGRDAARLEGSKVFAKEIMEQGGVPTAWARSFTDCDAALAFAREKGAPIVVKADGLAAGKGVAVCLTPEEAERAIRESLDDRVFGEAGARVLIEEFLEGEEASILVLCDGEHVVPLVSSQDHKRALDGDRGPNTGGMGAYSPAPCVTDDLWPVIREQVVERTLVALQARGLAYKGVLYAGLMLTPSGPKVLEFNCRFGDPETQAVLARWKGDMLPALEACVDGTLCEELVQWKQDHAVCVVLASGGYPGDYEKGREIHGLDAAGAMENVMVFHAGTTLLNGRVVTSGGRVLGVTALGETLSTAVKRVYDAVDHLSFDGGFCRKDIAFRALEKPA